MHEKAEAQREGRVNRKPWTKPEVRRLTAGEAEAAAGVGADLPIYS